MEIKKDFSCVEHCGKAFTRQIEVENDFQAALPAYCDDVYRIVNCCANSSINSAEISINEIKLYGKTEICITYYNESSSLCYVDFEEEFVKTVNAEGLSDSAFLSAEIFDKYTNYRVINQRRIDVHSSSVIQLTVYDKNNCPSVCSCDNSKLKIEKYKVADIFNTAKQKLEFDEEFTLPSGSEPIKRVVAFNMFSSLSEIKLIKDKALIKAVVSVSILYTADNDSEALERAEYSFNASKIIDSPGISDEDLAIVKLNNASLFVKAKSNSNDKITGLDVFGDIIADITFIKEKETELVNDGYIPYYQSECTYSDFSFSEAGKRISDNKSFNLSYRMPDDVEKIYDVSLKVGNITTGNGVIKAKAQISVIFESISKEISSFSGEEDISFDINGFSDAVTSIYINSYDYTISNNNTLELRLNVNLEAYAFNNRTAKVLSDIFPGENRINMPALTVYFGKTNESLWDIAKAFSSDLTAIKNENNLQGDTLSSQRVLIIPKA